MIYPLSPRSIPSIDIFSMSRIQSFNALKNWLLSFLGHHLVSFQFSQESVIICPN